MLVLAGGLVWPVVVEQLAVVLRCGRGAGRRADGTVVRIVWGEGRRRIGRVQLGTQELIGRLVDGPRRELRRVGTLRGEVVRRRVGGEGAPVRRVMGRLLVELLLHGPLFYVVGEFCWRHSRTTQTHLH